MLPDLFQTIPKSAMRQLSLSKGQHLFHQDKQTGGLFYVRNGKIELRRMTQSGDLLLVHQAINGETFAEASLFSDHYHCDAISTDESNLVEIDRKYVLAHLQTDANFAIAMTKHLARQNQLYRRKLEIMAIKSAPDRVYSALSDDMLKSDVISLAAEIGLTHEAVYRSLRKLVKQGRVVQTGRGKYEVKLTSL